VILFLLQFGIPISHSAEAAELEAGVAPQSVWLSKSRVVAGDSVNIFTVVYNSSNTAITGQVVFSIDDTPVGNKDFALKEGEAQIASQQWIAQEGSHSVSARITNTFTADTKKVTVVLNRSSGSIAISVEKPPPPPSPAVQVLNSVSSAIVTGVASSVPAAMSALTSLYDTTESLRMQAKSALEERVETDASTPGPTPSGTTIANGQANTAGTSSSATQTDTSILANAGRYAALAGLAVVNSKTLFYIALALVLILIIQMLRVFLRERRGKY